MRLSEYRIALAVVLSMASAPISAAEPETVAERKADWQKRLDELKLPEKLLTNPFQCVLPSHVKTDCSVHIIYGEKGDGPLTELTFKFVRDGKEILSLSGHRRSVFGFWKNKLYFVKYGTGGNGALV